MVEKDDWRLTGQKNYLRGVTLYWRKYSRYSDTWDHDHCDFCGAEFCLEGCDDALLEGYTTEDEYYWICETCFKDFKDMFQWKLGN